MSSSGRRERRRRERDEEENSSSEDTEEETTSSPSYSQDEDNGEEQEESIGEWNVDGDDDGPQERTSFAKPRCDDHPNDSSMSTQLAIYLLLATMARILLFCYGLGHDALFKGVKYTDIDYVVFTDGARYLAQGKSPFFRAGYRYSPLLAYALLPNALGFYVFGKLLFVALDIATGFLLYKVLNAVKRHHDVTISDSSVLTASAIWLFSPLSMIISTRGSCDSLITFLVLLVLWTLVTRHEFLSGLTFGFVCHLRIFPAIYAPALYLAMAHQNQPSLVSLWNPFTRRRLAFGIGALLAFGAPTAFCYARFGQTFLDETYLYHLHRRDTQHNFSIYFYLYRLVEDSEWRLKAIAYLAFLPHLAATIYATVLMARVMSSKTPSKSPWPTLFFALFFQTFVFVHFNKCLTSQYLVWYACLFPLVIPFLNGITTREYVTMALAWAGGQIIWLLPAYLYEFEQVERALIFVWLASVLFLVISCAILARIRRAFIAGGHHTTTVMSSSDIKSD